MGTLLALVVALSTPCAAEDSQNCYWDAQARSNGLGTSFVTFADVTLYFGEVAR